MPHALSRSADPYEALYGLPGATWKLADRAAELLGHPSGSAARGGAALLQALRQAAEAEGHTYLPWATLAAGAGRRPAAVMNASMHAARRPPEPAGSTA